jgi:hypothetical protein
MRLFSSLRMLIAPMGNTAFTTYQLCRLLQVPVTRTYIQQQLEAHPDYPSLLAVSDVLHGLTINNLSIQTDAQQLQQLPTPLVAQLQGQSDPQFVVVTGFDNDAVHYYHPEYNRSVAVAKGKFDIAFTGVVLLAEASALSGEKDFWQHARKERQQLLLKILPACCLISMVLLTCFITCMSQGMHALPNILYTLLLYYLLRALQWRACCCCIRQTKVIPYCGSYVLLVRQIARLFYIPQALPSSAFHGVLLDALTLPVLYAAWLLPA